MLPIELRGSSFSQNLRDSLVTPATNASIQDRSPSLRPSQYGKDFEKQRADRDFRLRETWEKFQACGQRGGGPHDPLSSDSFLIG